MTIDEFIEREMRETGKTRFTYTEVIALTEKWIAEKQAAAAKFEGWKDASVNELMGVEVRK